MKKRIYRQWRPEAIEKIRQDYQTLPVRDLARKNAVTLKNMESIIRRFGIARPSGTEAQNEGSFLISQNIQ